MPAARCSIDGINYPVEIGEKFGGKCPVCGEELTFAQNLRPDPDWMQQLEDAKKRLEELEYEAVSLGPEVVEGVEVYEEHGLLWVSNFDLWPKIEHRPPSFSQLKIDGTLYEVQGWDAPRRRWWLEELPGGED